VGERRGREEREGVEEESACSTVEERRPMEKEMPPAVLR
jgi:hypothetical protein